MTCKREALQRPIDLTPSSPLRDCVRRALYFRRGRLHAAVVAAGFAGMTPLALGAAFPPVVPLSSLFPAAGGDGSRGFVLTGVDAFDESGYSVDAAGDVNGDGIADIIIGAWIASDPNRNSVGETYVVFGRAAAP